MKPEAVVVIPAFNGVATIEAALDSVVVSAIASGRDVVISVHDDASVDETVAVVEAFAAASPVRVTLTRGETNAGTGAARNRAVAAEEAPILLFLDQDDLYLEPHVSVCLDLLSRNPGVGHVRTGVSLDAEVHPDWESAIGRSLVQTLAVRRHAHRLVGGFIEDPAVAVVGCDDVFYNRLLAQCTRGLVVPERTVRFTHRPGNSFDRQYERKFSKPPGDAVDTLSGARAAQVDVALAAFAAHADGVARRLGRLTGRALVASEDLPPIAVTRACDARPDLRGSPGHPAGNEEAQP